MIWDVHVHVAGVERRNQAIFYRQDFVAVWPAACSFGVSVWAQSFERG